MTQREKIVSQLFHPFPQDLCLRFIGNLSEMLTRKRKREEVQQQCGPYACETCWIPGATMYQCREGHLICSLCFSEMGPLALFMSHM